MGADGAEEGGGVGAGAVGGEEAQTAVGYLAGIIRLICIFLLAVPFYPSLSVLCFSNNIVIYLPP